jgi:hypothetical protein
VPTAAAAAIDAAGVLVSFGLLAVIVQRAILAGSWGLVLTASPGFALAATGWIMPGGAGVAIMAAGVPFIVAMVTVAYRGVRVEARRQRKELVSEVEAWLRSMSNQRPTRLP